MTRATGPQESSIDIVDQNGLRRELEVGAGGQIVESIVAPARLAGLWIEVIGAHPLAYRILRVLRVQGRIDEDALRMAVEDVLAHHVAFDLAMPEVDGKIRITRKSGPLTPLWINESTDVESALEAWSARPLNVATGDMIRMALFGTGESRTLAVAIHHLICDQLSLSVLFEDLATAYRSRRDRQVPLLPPTGSFLSWLQQDKVVSPKAKSNDMAYWQKTLKGAPFNVRLPEDRPQRTAGNPARVVEFPFNLAPHLIELAADRGQTPFSVLLAALSFVVGGWTGRSDTIFGTTVIDRPSRQWERTIGFMVRVVPLRIDWTGAKSCGELMDAAQKCLLGALDHDAVDFREIYWQLQASGQGTVEALFRVVLEVNYSTATPAFDGLTMAWEEKDTKPATYDLLFSVLLDAPGEFFTATYDANRFQEATVKELLRQWAYVTESFLKESGKDLKELSLLSPGRALAVQERLQSGPLIGAQSSLLDSLRHRAEVAPGRTVLIAWEDGKKVSITAKELLRMVLVAGAELEKHGASQFVGVPFKRRCEDVASFLAAHAAGRAYVPLDPTMPDEWVRKQVHLLGINTVLGGIDLVGRTVFAECNHIDINSNRVGLLAGTRSLPGNTAAYAILTSGTTGDPKAVIISHGALTHFYAAMRQLVFSRLPQVRRAAINAPFLFDASLQQLFYLSNPAVQILLVPGEVRRDPKAFVSFLRREHVNVVDCTPTMARLLVEAGLPASTSLIVGGEAIDEDLWQRLAQHTAPVFNVYGPTECTINATACLVSGDLPNLGQPLAGIGVWIIGRHGGLAAPNEIGEIYLTGPQLAIGYAGAGEREQRNFGIAEFPPIRGQRYYRTGDKARITPAGVLVYEGREEGEGKVDGVRINLAGIESDLRHYLHASEVKVMLIDGKPGTGLQLTAFIVSPRPVDGVALRKALAKRRPAWEIPVRFVHIPAMPLGPSGKIDRRELSEMAQAAGACESAAVPTCDSSCAALARIWEDLLGCSASVHDNFFELGGHSLLMLRLTLRVKQELGVTLEIGDLFRAPVLQNMALAISFAERESHQRASSTVVEMVSGSGHVLVLCHPLGGEVLCYRDLCAHIATQSPRPVYGCRSRALVDGSKEADTAEEMTLRYAEDLLQILPEGPLAIVGWSLGGLIALSVGRLLSDAGREVSFVEVWDCGLTTGHAPSQADSVRLALRIAFGGRMADAFRNAEDFERFLQDHADQSRPNQLMAIVAHARSCGIAGIGKGDNETMIEVSRHLELSLHQSRLFENWWPPQVTFPIYSMLAQDSLHRGQVAHTNWGDFTSNETGVEVIDVDHYSMVRAPRVAETARRLIQRLGPAL